MGGYRIKVHRRDEHREEREVPVKIRSQSGSEAAKTSQFTNYRSKENDLQTVLMTK